MEGGSRCALPIHDLCVVGRTTETSCLEDRSTSTNVRIYGLDTGFGGPSSFVSWRYVRSSLEYRERIAVDTHQNVHSQEQEKR